DGDDEGGSGGGAVALPRPLPVRAVVGREEQRAVDVGQVAEVRAGTAGVNVGDQDGSGGGAVALPQLGPLDAVVGGEVSGRADRRVVVGDRGQRRRIDVTDHI